MIPRHDGGRDDIDTWPGEHYKKVKMKARYVGRVQPPTAQGDGYIYSPPAWRVCEVCGGHGKVDMGLMTGHARGRIETCYQCKGTGRIPIHYTPEQWKEAGGILGDNTPVWVCSDGEWIILACYGDFKSTQMTIVIATEAGRPPEEE